MSASGNFAIFESSTEDETGQIVPVRAMIPVGSKFDREKVECHTIGVIETDKFQRQYTTATLKLVTPKKA